MNHAVVMHAPLRPPRPSPGSGRTAAPAACVLGLALLASCNAGDPKKDVGVDGLEGFWAVDTPQGRENFIVPVVRFRIRNASPAPLQSVRAMATFRRKGESGTWGSSFREIATWRQPLAPGASAAVELRSEARYHSPGPPEGMFQHALFRDATAEVFVELGSSGWVKVASADVARRLGSASSPLATPP